MSTIDSKCFANVVSGTVIAFKNRKVFPAPEYIVGDKVVVSGNSAWLLLSDSDAGRYVSDRLWKRHAGRILSGGAVPTPATDAPSDSYEPPMPTMKATAEALSATAELNHADAAGGTNAQRLLAELREAFRKGVTQTQTVPGEAFPIGSHHHPLWVAIAEELSTPPNTAALESDSVSDPQIGLKYRRSIDEQVADHFSMDQQESYICIDDFEDALRTAEARGRALAVEEFSKTPDVKAIAYFAELGTVIDQETREYSGWEPRLSRIPFCVPAGSIRNDTPLVDARPYLRTIAALESLRPHWAEGYTEDSQAAQAKTIALSQIWDFLQVEDQSSAMQRLRDIREHLTVLLRSLENRTVTHDTSAAEAYFKKLLRQIGKGEAA